MKTRLSIWFTLTTCILFGQQTTTRREVVTLLHEQSVYLNSTSNGFAGGNSRLDYKIDLPPNTVEWYYMYSTTPTEGMNQSLGLVSQLTRLVDPSGLTALTINQLATPSGSGGVIDAFVMNYNARAAFYEKDMFGAWV